jgi:MoxR-like ATPase
MEPTIDIESEQNIIQEREIDTLRSNLQSVILGKPTQIDLVVTTLVAGGHILIEDNPGTGKTVLAKTLAGSVGGGASFKRVQFTPDLLPMDLLGSFIFDEKNTDFVFKKGPLFCNVLLADEINRASPKVQSALLEAMAEHQITMGDTTHKLEDLFFTIATQNPIEMEGTYPLPAAQLDRFFMKIYFGYVDEQAEIDIYTNYQGIHNKLNDLNQVISLQQVISAQREAEQIEVHEEIIKAVSNIVRATRENPNIMLGASPRSGIIFLKCLRAYAYLQNRTFVIEDDIKALCFAVLEHRLEYRNKEGKKGALQQILDKELNRLNGLKIS